MKKRLRKEGNMLGLPIKQNLCPFSVSLDAVDQLDRIQTHAEGAKILLDR
jgi:hypothetical protein